MRTGAKNLLLHNFVALSQARDDRRGEEEAAVADAVAAGADRGVCGEPLDQAEDAVELGLAVERAVGESGERRRSGDRCFGSGDEGVQECVVDAVMRQDAGGGGAVLAGVVEAAGDDAVGRRLDVCVLEDEDGGVSAEFEVGLLDVGRCRAGDLDARPGRSGNGYQRRRRVGDEGAARVAVAEDDVDHARRQEGRCRLGQQDGAGRCRLGGLEDGRVAGCDSGAELPDRHHQGVVPRGDLGADTERFAADEGRVPVEVLARCGAFQQPCGPGEDLN